tara:strand:- start:1211 stop:1810 length:600 start_codon:yes stop_codon:yes gene_type:complete
MTKEQEQLFDYLLEYWNTVVSSFRTELERAYPMSSGGTADAIGAGNQNPITITANGFMVEISMPSYYQFLDEGVSGAKYNKGISRFKYTDKMPPLSAMLTFMDNRGITKLKPSKKKPKGAKKSSRLKRNNRPKNTRSGQKRDADSIRNAIAFAIAKSIFNKGLKPSHFYSNVINDNKILDFESKLLSEFDQYILSVVKV